MWSHTWPPTTSRKADTKPPNTWPLPLSCSFTTRNSIVMRFAFLSNAVIFPLRLRTAGLRPRSKDLVIISINLSSDGGEGSIYAEWRMGKGNGQKIYLMMTADLRLRAKRHQLAASDDYLALRSKGHPKGRRAPKTFQ